MNLEEIHNRVQLLWPKKMSKKIYLSGDKYWDKLREEVPSQLIHGLKKHNDKIGDALSQGQIKSKQWLLSKIKGIDLGIVFICAGWYGTLATMMFEDENIYVDKIRSFDIDDSCLKIAEDLNEPWKADNWVFKATTLDIVSFFTNGYYSDKDTTVINKITNLDNTWSLEEKEKSDTNKTYHYYTINVKGEPKLCQEVPDTIINTSCEHIDPIYWAKRIPEGVRIIAQSNNMKHIKEHQHCVDTVEELLQQIKLTNIEFAGSLPLPGGYKRFMVIGHK